jgi:hypothetical protein
MPRTFIDALADAEFEARIAQALAEAAARADRHGDADSADSLWEANRSVRVRCIRHRAEAYALMTAGPDRSGSDGSGPV